MNQSPPSKPAVPESSILTVSVTRRKALFGAALAVLVVALGISGFWYQQRGATDDQEVRKYQAEIGRLAILPDQEIPALGTITDPSKLGHQKFFKDAQEGDKTLIYSESNVVVLYRPSAKKIVNMGPVEIAAISPEPSSSR